MEKIASGMGCFGDCDWNLYLAKDGRHYVRIRHYQTFETPETIETEWLNGDDWREWYELRKE